MTVSPDFLDKLPQAEALARQRWSEPNALYATGFDPRSSDNALLALMYGGIEQASRHEWLNAGRRLIDKTYINIVMHRESLTAMQACSPERIAAGMDEFIHQTVAPNWQQLLSGVSYESLAADFMQQGRSIFCSLTSDIAASRLLFYLFPQLPIFPFSRGHRISLKGLDLNITDDSYESYRTASADLYTSASTELNQLALPKASYGNEHKQRLITEILEQTDWWQRHVFRTVLEVMLDDDQQTLLGCNGDGLFAD